MSTFDGEIREFPEIRVDFFRGILESPPLAGFLSHVHSDHLAGLDTYRGRPIYCSAATRAMLLKLQRCSSRINFHQGLLEKEEITYKHQKRRLKALPLQTPTEIELEPGNSIRVTLFDANHCPGAVMFLFEGKGKAVLYTGDIRSERWHVNAVARSPSMIEYSSGLKTLDKVYLDTSFTEDVVFQTKSEGLRELLDKVSKYPKETRFHFSAWTYGYEEVWIALAKALDTRIHVDDYKLNVYRALRIKLDEDQYFHLSPEAAALTGYTCGNRFQPGLLTSDETVQLHSCEKGTRCATLAKGDVVWITPIVTHLSSTSDMAEVGIGGGVDDLEQKDELVLSPEDARLLLQSVSESKDLPQDAKDLLPNILLSAASGQRPITLALPPSNNEDAGDPTGLQRALKSLTNASEKGRGQENAEALPNKIRFPYSRHSSYRELCHLLEVLKPKDVWPCTVDPVRWIKQGITIEGLFGNYCVSNEYQHDQHMAEVAVKLDMKKSEHHQSQTSNESAGGDDFHTPIDKNLVASKEALASNNVVHSTQATTASLSSVRRNVEGGNTTRQPTNGHQQTIDLTFSSDASQDAPMQREVSSSSKRPYGEFAETQQIAVDDDQDGESTGEGASHFIDSQSSSLSARRLEARQNAFNAMIGDRAVIDAWNGLLSTTNNHTHPESELGEG